MERTVACCLSPAQASETKEPPMTKKHFCIRIAALAAVSGTAIAAPTVASLTVTQPTAAAATVAAVAPSTTMTPAADNQADLRLEALGMGDMVRVSVFRNPEL